MSHSKLCIFPKLSLANTTMVESSKVMENFDKEKAKFRRKLLKIISSISAQLECLGSSLHTLTDAKRIEVETVMKELTRRQNELLSLL
nr:hypothetical protein [Candidatus Gracilibacteria bacterium]